MSGFIYRDEIEGYSFIFRDRSKEDIDVTVEQCPSPYHPFDKDCPLWEEPEDSSYDPVKRPSHYNQHPSGVECIEITQHMNFPLGSAIKYIWRADLKGNAIQDLEKAREYLDVEIAKRKKLSGG